MNDNDTEQAEPDEDGLSIKITEHKVKRTTIEDLLNADLDSLTASFQQHAKKVLFDGNSHHGA